MNVSMVVDILMEIVFTVTGNITKRILKMLVVFVRQINHLPVIIAGII